jgi:hypothetical protein
MEYWCARANRAIATCLVRTNALVDAHRRNLELTRRSLRLKASLVQDGDLDAWRRLGTQLAGYYRANGRLLQQIERLGTRLDRSTS